jgi:hypothetical protein
MFEVSFEEAARNGQSEGPKGEMRENQTLKECIKLFSLAEGPNETPQCLNESQGC